MKYIIHTDGGSRGNPGPAAIGVVIELENSSFPTKRTLVYEFGKTIGRSTNNIAEYLAVVEALTILKKMIVPQITKSEVEKIVYQFFLDSLLVVNQLNGVFKVKDANLRQVLIKIRILEKEIFGSISYLHIPREENSRADFFVNLALDKELKH